MGADLIPLPFMQYFTICVYNHHTHTVCRFYLKPVPLPQQTLLYLLFQFS